MPIDYEKCMKSILQIENNSSNFDNAFFILNAIRNYINRVIEVLEKNKSDRNEVLSKYFENIIDKECQSFDEALQRILLYNQLLWQTNHRLVGLGRLDKLLYRYYDNDIRCKILTKEEAYNMIKKFLSILHKDYCFKSNVMLGDTGQLIVLAGLDDRGQYISNDLTYMFIDAIKDLQIPDPKILLRVSKKTSRLLLDKSLSCIKTGIGCPVFSNDEIVIKALKSAGYDKKDVFDYVTSACWEPLILGKSFDQNNLSNIKFLEPLNMIFKNDSYNSIDTFDELLDCYDKKMDIYIKEIVDYTNSINFQEDPLMSIFTYDCVVKNLDISKGGAKYNNFGLLSVGLSNTINSLLVLKKYAFDEKIYTLNELNMKRINENMEDLNIEKRFGDDSREIIDLTNRIMNIASKHLAKYKNKLGGKYKFGLSSPNYIVDSYNTEASFDGRKRNMPYNVHISSETPLAYTGLTLFAGKLDYNANKYNGNVVDFFVSPNFIDNNYDKFLDFLTYSLKTNFFEMQMNVVSSDTLIKAKINPEQFPNLIVRVWGFSAYFNDLPDEYKNVLIDRALKNEGKCL
jgi:formate C-acetyltransferase